MYVHVHAHIVCIQHVWAEDYFQFSAYILVTVISFVLCNQMSQCVLLMVPAMDTLVWRENIMADLPQGPQSPSHVMMAMVQMEDMMW